MSCWQLERAISDSALEIPCLCIRTKLPVGELPVGEFNGIYDLAARTILTFRVTRVSQTGSRVSRMHGSGATMAYLEQSPMIA